MRRKVKKDKEGNIKLRLTYPKYKYGEATVREVREKQNYGKRYLINYHKYNMGYVVTTLLINQYSKYIQGCDNNFYTVHVPVTPMGLWEGIYGEILKL